MVFSAISNTDTKNHNNNTIEDIKISTSENKNFNMGIFDDSNDDDPGIIAFFTNLKQTENEISKSKYLYSAHKINQIKQNEDKTQDTHKNISDFLPEPRFLQQVLKLSRIIKDKWGDAIRKEIQGLFDNDTFDTDEKSLPADKVLPVKLELKVKLNAHGGLDKLKARICLRGDMQVKDGLNTWLLHLHGY